MAPVAASRRWIPRRWAHGRDDESLDPGPHRRPVSPTPWSYLTALLTVGDGDHERGGTRRPRLWSSRSARWMPSPSRSYRVAVRKYTTGRSAESATAVGRPHTSRVLPSGRRRSSKSARSPAGDRSAGRPSRRSGRGGGVAAGRGRCSRRCRGEMVVVWWSRRRCRGPGRRLAHGLATTDPAPADEREEADGSSPWRMRVRLRPGDSTRPLGELCESYRLISLWCPRKKKKK